MERFAAESLIAERDAHVKAALKANQPWMDVMAQYGMTLAEIMDIAEKMGMASKRGGATVMKTDNDTDGLIAAPRQGRR